MKSVLQAHGYLWHSEKGFEHVESATVHSCTRSFAPQQCTLPRMKNTKRQKAAKSTRTFAACFDHALAESYWRLVGNMGQNYLGIIFPCSLLGTWPESHDFVRSVLNAESSSFTEAADAYDLGLGVYRVYRVSGVYRLYGVYGVDRVYRVYKA